jgi:hypothetical protein
MHKLKSFFPILVLILVVSCSSPDPLDVDVSAIAVPQAVIQRFDQDFFNGDTLYPKQLQMELQKKYGVFSRVFFTTILCPYTRDSAICLKEMVRFLSDKDMRGVWTDINRRYPDLKQEELELTSAYRYFKYHFPSRNLPKSVQATVTGFNYQYTHTEGNYGIGIDYFLGKDSKWYAALQWPMYRRLRHERSYMVPGLIRSWMLNEFPYQPPQSDVLNRMVYEGKLLYLSKAMLRDHPDSILTGFRQKQLDWCTTNEGSIWAAMIDKKLLYSQAPQDMQHMIDDAPFAPDFPRESPGRIGIWVGLRIVEAYMQRYPQTPLEELMRIQDAQQILTRSKYKPRL